MQGLHPTADLRGCPIARPAMTQPHTLRGACLAAVRQAGLAPEGELFHRFTPAPGAAQDALKGTLFALFEPAQAGHHALQRGGARRAVGMAVAVAP